MVSAAPAPAPAGPPETSVHENRCSFCLGPREQGRDIIAAERVSICVPCVRLHRRWPWWDPRGWLARLRTRRTRVAPVSPYRDALGSVCSFCQTEAPIAVRGAAAQICAPCMVLAVGVLPPRGS
jgi:hypothetical protein